ncbi:MAG TPA: ABC transporter ATP-binding protein [Polyangiaceae bacterium]|jgi:putative ABC transport system ATP-binding protein
MAAAASLAVASRGTGEPTEVAPPRAPLVELSSVSKDYATGGGLVRAVRDVDLRIAHGEFVAIVGASGSGKSTMMNVIGCLDRPTTGTYELAGIDVGGRDGDSRAIIRNRIIGFIFQGFNLLPRTTALENVELPLQYRGVRARERRRRAKAALEAVGLAARLDHSPSQLSGGQQQRVAIARALVTDPPLLLADEPTGNLDTRTSLEVLALLQRLNRERGITVILVTHERDVASCASRVITMRDGRIVSDVLQGTPLDAAAEVARMPVAEEETAAPAALGAASVDPAARVGARVPFAVYAAMWLGELAGEAAGAAYAGFVLHLGPLQAAWVARAVGEIAKAWAGARWARRAFGKPATVDQRVRMALWYTMVVTGGALAVVLGVVLALPARLSAKAAWAFDGIAPITERGPAAVMAVVAAALGALALLRFLLLSLFEPRR